MNGLEAIKAMQEGKIVTEGTNIFKIEKGNVLSSYVGSCAELNDGVFNTACGFDFSLTYEEYIPPKTGWEGDYGERYFYVNSECFIFCTWDNDAPGDKRAYDKANYFSTIEKAKEINFKQTLLRKMQRFSDKNGGSEIDWVDGATAKYHIYFDYESESVVTCESWELRDLGQVYFKTEEIAEQAIKLFKEALIKYFTHDWSKGE